MLTSCMIFTMLGKALLTSGVYSIDKISPETVCMVRVIPRRKPMFHKNEIDVGVGRSLREVFIILRIGLFVLFCGFIKM